MFNVRDATKERFMAKDALLNPFHDSDYGTQVPTSSNQSRTTTPDNRINEGNSIEECIKCVHHFTDHVEVSGSSEKQANKFRISGLRDKLTSTIRIPNATGTPKHSDNPFEAPKNSSSRSSLVINQPSPVENPPKFSQKIISRLRSISTSQPVEFCHNDKSSSLIEEADEDADEADRRMNRSTLTTKDVQPKISYTFGVPSHAFFKRKPRIRTMSRSEVPISSSYDSSNQLKYSMSVQPDRMFEQLLGAVDIISTRRRSISHVFERPPNLFNLNKAVDCDTHIVISKSIDKDPILEPFNRANYQSFDKENMMTVLLQHATAYDIMPDSAKFVILDSNLPISKSIQCLLENGIHSAPIWRSKEFTFIGTFNQFTALHLLATAISVPKLTPCALYKTEAPLCSSSLSMWQDKSVQDVLTLFTQISCDKYSYCPVNVFSKRIFVSPTLSMADVFQLFINPYKSFNNTKKEPLDESEEKAVLIAPPSEVVIVEPTQGNALGIITMDRLIYYVRLKLDHVPHSDILKSPISSLPTYIDSILSKSASHTWSLVEPRGEEEPINLILHPHQTTCLQALHVFDQVLLHLSLNKLPSIPWLPVVENSRLLGIISPGDLLYYFLEITDMDTAHDKISKILQTKYPICSQQMDFFCDSEDTVFQVIDKMYRFKTTMLLCYDRESKGFTCFVTAIDILTHILDLHEMTNQACSCCCCQCQFCTSLTSNNFLRSQKCENLHEDNLFKMDIPEENGDTELTEHRARGDSLINQPYEIIRNASYQAPYMIYTQLKSIYDYISESENYLLSKFI